MNQSDEELENELAALVPTQPHEILAQRISEELEPSKIIASRPLIKLWPIVALASAACFLVTLKLLTPYSTSERAPKTLLANTIAGPDSFQAIKAEQHLLDAIDEGVVLTANDELVRRLRYEFIDTVTMINQNDGSIFTVEIPREEILCVPVTLL